MLIFHGNWTKFASEMGKYYTYVPGAEFPHQYKYEPMAVTTDGVSFTDED